MSNAIIQSTMLARSITSVIQRSCNSCTYASNIARQTSRHEKRSHPSFLMQTRSLSTSISSPITSINQRTSRFDSITDKDRPQPRPTPARRPLPAEPKRDSDSFKPPSETPILIKDLQQRKPGGGGGGGGGGASSTSTNKHASESTSSVESLRDMTPRQLVAHLNEHIIGQMDAKRQVASAMRARWRRQRMEPNMRQVIYPKNILLTGPTGCGKTEIARRLSNYTDAPFIKVEATKFTEVGFHGRDVSSIIEDLCRLAHQQVKQQQRQVNADKVNHKIEEKILDALLGPISTSVASSSSSSSRQFKLSDPSISLSSIPNTRTIDSIDEASLAAERLKFRNSQRQFLRDGLLDHQIIELRLPTQPKSSNGGNVNTLTFGEPNDDSSSSSPSTSPSSERRRLTIRQARRLLSESESDSLLSKDELQRLVRRRVEDDGIVFIDEIDKICSPRSFSHRSADASSEGVQRDLLPLIEGCNVTVKDFGDISTQHILFICGGAFHAVSPSDLLAELQGRLPIRVELQSLTEDDFVSILTKTKSNLIRQHQSLLSVDGLMLTISDAAIREIARITVYVNKHVENIGARRLHTVIEHLVNDISYNAPDLPRGTQFHIDYEFVKNKTKEMQKTVNLQQFIL